MASKDDKQARGESRDVEARFRTLALGLFLMTSATALAFAIFVIWPEAVFDTSGRATGQWVETLRVFDGDARLDSEARLLLLVMFVAALGSCLHAATSFASYVGNESLVPSWTWWYVLRPFIGAVLGLIFYFVIRGGLLSTGADTSAVSLFGLVAVAGLAGMFSKQAIDKLRELFDNLFRTATDHGDSQRRDKLFANLAVEEHMIPIGKITAYRMSVDEKASAVKILEVYKKYGGLVTRLPILSSDGLVLHVIHQSLVYQFISAESVAAAQKQKTFDPGSASLRDFLDFDDMPALVTDSLAFVPATATIAQAKAKMEDTPKCQDVFVTKNGTKTDPILGWLTNVDIGRLSKA